MDTVENGLRDRFSLSENETNTTQCLRDFLQMQLLILVLHREAAIPSIQITLDRKAALAAASLRG